MVEVLSPLLWAQRHFGRAELGHKRRTQRVVTYAAAAAQAPSQSIPQQCGGAWKRTKGAYRLFDQPSVSFDKVQESHRRLTRDAAAAATRSVVLWVSDTTTLSFAHPATTGLGPTSTGGSGSGMLLHTTMAVDVSGGIDAAPFVLGLGHQRVWTRPAKGKANVPESIKWQSGIKAIGTPPPPSSSSSSSSSGVRWVHVGDSESDCWEAIESCKDEGSGFALRACQNRQVIAGHVSPDEAASAAESRLFELLQQEPALGNKKLWVRGRPDRPARWAQLAVSATAVTLLPPRNWPDKPHRKGKPRPQPIRCWAVRVYEINAPDGVDEPIEWVILTDEPVRDLATALTVVFWYSCRWLIEEYHKCLKSGCQIESRQLEEASRLKALLGILAVVAVRLLQLKHQAKVKPESPALSIIPTRYVEALGAHLKQPFEKMTTREFWRATAALGGFLGRTGDGEPGYLTLWRGWQQLTQIHLGYQLAKQLLS